MLIQKLICKINNTIFIYKYAFNKSKNDTNKLKYKSTYPKEMSEFTEGEVSFPFL